MTFQKDRTTTNACYHILISISK